MTTHSAAELNPVWSPDGAYIAFSSERDGPMRVYRQSAGGGGAAEQLLPGRQFPPNNWLSDWSRDGRFLALSAQRPGSRLDLFAVPLQQDGELLAYLATEFSEGVGRFSPDSRWMAYHLDKSGQLEVYIGPFPKADREWKVSTAGGSSPLWRRDGKELYYIAPDGTLMAVPINPGELLEVGAPEPLFQTRIVVLRANARGKYDVSADGKRFLIANRTQEAAAPRLTVITNWLKAVQR